MTCWCCRTATWRSGRTICRGLPPRSRSREPAPSRASITGRGDAGRWSEIDAAIASYSGTPKVVMSLTLGAARPCMGSTIALSRETLAAIGGFERFADVLADDYAIGQAVAAQGLQGRDSAAPAGPFRGRAEPGRCLAAPAALGGDDSRRRAAAPHFFRRGPCAAAEPAGHAVPASAGAWPCGDSAWRCAMPWRCG